MALLSVDPLPSVKQAFVLQVELSVEQLKKAKEVRVCHSCLVTLETLSSRISTISSKRNMHEAPCKLVLGTRIPHLR